MMHTNAANVAVGFSLGEIVVDRQSLGKLSSEDIVPALSRHLLGDWGRVDRRKWGANNRALYKKRALHSVYFSTDGIRFEVVTNASRSMTTVKLG